MQMFCKNPCWILSSAQGLLVPISAEPGWVVSRPADNNCSGKQRWEGPIRHTESDMKRKDFHPGLCEQSTSSWGRNKARKKSKHKGPSLSFFFGLVTQRKRKNRSHHHKNTSVTMFHSAEKKHSNKNLNRERVKNLMSSFLRVLPWLDLEKKCRLDVKSRNTNFMEKLTLKLNIPEVIWPLHSIYTH